MNSSNILRNILKLKKRSTLEFYHKQFETRDFITNDLVIYKNDNKYLIKCNKYNYYSTKEFKNYKPNFKKMNVLDDSYIKYLDSM